MNAKFYFLSVATLLAAALTAQAQNTTIDLDVSGLPDGTQVKLSLGVTHDDEPAIQTAAIQDGKAYFAFDSEEPRLYALTTESPRGYLDVLVTKGDHVKIHAVAQKQHNQRGDYYLFEPVQVRDSYLHKEMLDKLSIRKAMDANYEKYHQDNRDILDKMAAAGDNQAVVDSLRQTPAYKQLEADERAFFESVEKGYGELYTANRESWWGPFLVLYTMNWIAPGVQSVYDQFSTEAKESFYGKILKEKLDEANGGGSKGAQLGKGAKVPDFSFTDQATGQTTSLYAQLQGKRYLLFDVWASWCGPCRREIPNFKAMYEQYKDKGFGVISISADEDNAAWLKALEEEQLPWPNGRDADKSIGQLYKVQYYPTVYLLDANGVVVARDADARGEKLQALLAELMK